MAGSRLAPGQDWGRHVITSYRGRTNWEPLTDSVGNICETRAGLARDPLLYPHELRAHAELGRKPGRQLWRQADRVHRIGHAVGACGHQ